MPTHSAKPPLPVTVAAALRPIFGQFLDIQRRQVAAMEAALGQGDMETVVRLAHTVKGAAATYQLPEAAALARNLEAGVRQGDRGEAAVLIAALARYFLDVEVIFEGDG